MVKQRKKEIYKHTLDPAEGNGEGNVLWGFDFKILPTAVLGADRDGLKHTQEAGGADGDTPAHSLNIQNKFAGKITGKIFQPQSCNCLRDLSREWPKCWLQSGACKSNSGPTYTECGKEKSNDRREKLPQIPSAVCNKKVIPKASWLEAASFTYSPLDGNSDSSGPEWLI